MYIKFLPINSQFSLPVPRGLPDCIGPEIRDEIIKFRMLNFLFFFHVISLIFQTSYCSELDKKNMETHKRI